MATAMAKETMPPCVPVPGLAYRTRMGHAAIYNAQHAQFVDGGQAFVVNTSGQCTDRCDAVPPSYPPASPISVEDKVDLRWFDLVEPVALLNSHEFVEEVKVCRSLARFGLRDAKVLVQAGWREPWPCEALEGTLRKSNDGTVAGWLGEDVDDWEVPHGKEKHMPEAETATSIHARWFTLAGASSPTHIALCCPRGDSYAELTFTWNPGRKCYMAPASMKDLIESTYSIKVEAEKAEPKEPSAPFNPSETVMLKAPKAHEILTTAASTAEVKIAIADTAPEEKPDLSAMSVSDRMAWLRKQKALKAAKRTTAPTEEPKAETKAPENMEATAAVETGVHGIMKLKPEDFEFYVVPKSSQLELFVQSEHPTAFNMILTGPAGCGKTELVFWYAAKYGRPLFVAQCGYQREPRDWFGRMMARDGKTYFEETGFLAACSTPGCVILLDELNRLHASVVNPLLPFLDHRRMVFVEETKRMIEVAPGVSFFATANVGANFSGTFQMDGALKRRFAKTIECTYLPPESEIGVLEKRTGVDHDTAMKLVKLATDVRGKASGSSATLTADIPTSALLAAALNWKLYTDAGQKKPIKSLDTTILPLFSADGGNDSERRQVLTLIQGIFGGA